MPALVAPTTLSGLPLHDLPRFLWGLHDVTAQGDGWIAECPICRDLLEVTSDAGHWLLECAGGCTHKELVDWLHADTHELHPDGEWSRRLWRAVMLSPSLFVCCALLAGERVPVSALDPVWARRFGVR